MNIIEDYNTEKTTKNETLNEKELNFKENFQKTSIPLTMT